jgi:hypothetical protein
MMLQPFLKLLEGETPGPVIWTADINYWLAGQQEAGTADPAWQTEKGYLRLHAELGIMPYYWYNEFWLAEPRYADEIQWRTEQDGQRTRTVIHTPLGDLSREMTYLPTSCSTGTTKHFVQSEDDLDILRHVIESRELLPAALNGYEERRSRWAAFDGLPSLALPRSPLSALAYEWMGVEHLVYLLADCRAKVEDLMQRMEEQEEPILDAVCDAAPPLIHFADNLSAETLAGLYDRYLAPVHRHRIERLHAAGTACAVHLDGVVRGLLGRLATAGFDAVEALTPQPAGDLTPRQMREAAGDERLILWGGVPGVMFAPPYRWADMERHVEALLQAWQGQRFVLGVADQVPPDGDVSFCRRIAEMLPT